MELTKEACLALSLLLAFTALTTDATSYNDDDPVISVQQFSSGAGCESDGKTFEEGEVIPHFNTRCILSRCIRGKRVEIRGDCVDSYGRCHPDGHSWRQGCRIYRCKVTKSTAPNGSVTTKYEPIKIRDCPKRS